MAVILSISLVSRWQFWEQTRPNGFPALSVLSWPVEWLVVIIIITLFVIFIIIAISIMMIMIGHHNKYNRGSPVTAETQLMVAAVAVHYHAFLDHNYFCHHYHFHICHHHDIHMDTTR